MSTPSISIDVAPRRRLWYRLHASTWVVVLLVAAILVLLIVPGEAVNPWDGNAPIKVDRQIHLHGWPSIYLAAPVVPNARRSPPGSLLGLPWTGRDAWSFDGMPSVTRTGWFLPGALVADLLIAVAAVGLAVIYWEWRRRRRTRLWQFSLFELTLLVTFAAPLLAWSRAIVTQHTRETAALARSPKRQFAFTSRQDWLYHHRPSALIKLVGIERAGFLRRVDELRLEGVMDADSVEFIDSFHSLRRLVIHCRLPGGPLPAALTNLASVEELELAGLGIDDSSLAMLAGMPRLRTLDVHSKRVTGKGLAHLRCQKTLERLDLSYSPITDDAVQHLVGMTRLTDVDLGRTDVTGASVLVLAHLPNLTLVDLRDTKVTAAGLAYLQSRRPTVKIAEPSEHGRLTID